MCCCVRLKCVCYALCRPRPLPDYADPDDALFDDNKYHTQPKTIKCESTLSLSSSEALGHTYNSFLQVTTYSNKPLCKC